jgi:hypothetical protein
MIRRTFQHIPGVGPWREKDLWARGVLTWDDFRAREGGEPVLSRELDRLAHERIALARAALDGRDLGALAGLIPPREHWRLYPPFAADALFFDIECDGGDAPAPTVVTVLDAGGIRTFIRGRNLDQLPEHLASRPLWVSFNGTVFDVPVLTAHFGALPRPAVHLDLRFFFRKLGRSAGLKALEDELGLSRPPHLATLNGLGAVDLWRAYRATGDLEPLRFLVEYNAYDAINLRGVLERGYNRAVDRLHFAGEHIPEFERGDVLYDLSRLLLALEPTDEDLRAQERARPRDRQVE